MFVVHPGLVPGHRLWLFPGIPLNSGGYSKEHSLAEALVGLRGWQIVAEGQEAEKSLLETTTWI